MKLMSARSRRAPAPVSRAKRAPESFAARAESNKPEGFPEGLVVARFEIKPGGAPTRRTS
jgi:hypothetical protein